MNICIKNTDLLKEKTDVIVNTVNCVGVMGKGIAFQFKQKWPDNFKAYQKACKKNLVRPGKIFIYEFDPCLESPRYIVNFPTKDHWKEKSKLSYIEEGLKDLIRFIQTHSIKSISVPPLGCGNGGLNWQEVLSLIKQHFEILEDHIDVYLFKPNYTVVKNKMDIRTQKPKMTVAKAVIIKLLSIYNQMRYQVSKIEVQKLCYFVQVFGEDLKLNFYKNKYGPYADNLRHVLNQMEGHYLVGVGDGSTKSEISLMEGSLENANLFLKQVSSNSIERINKVAELIDGFETPYGMELLSTVHWVLLNYQRINQKDPQLFEVIDGVYNWQQENPDWNSRKRAIMKEKHIEIALEQLNRK